MTQHRRFSEAGHFSTSRVADPFFLEQGDPQEPAHVHIRKDGVDAKFWLNPVSVAYNEDFNAKVLADLLELIENRRTEIKGVGMTTSDRATTVRFDEHSMMWVDLDDGRTVGLPLAWFPRLMRGSPKQRSQVVISPSGLHWEELDEDISIAGVLAGRGDMTRARSDAA